MKWIFWTRTQPITPDDCGTIDPLLSLYADGMASPEEAHRVEAHLPGCAACRESLAWMQATQRALAARPVASPPADLRARIAGAIAASSAAPIFAPVPARPARAFVLRPAFAAAASLTALGVIASYSLLHQQPSVAVHPAPSSVKVATVTPTNAAPPVVKPAPGHGVKPPVAHRQPAAPRPARLDPDRVARVQPDEAQPEPAAVRTPAKMGHPVKMPVLPAPMLASAKPHDSAIKKLSLRKPHPALVAKVNTPAAPVEGHKTPILKPEERKPEIVASVPHDLPASVPVNVGVPSIKHDPAPTVAVASAQEGHVQRADLLGSVREHLGQMRSIALTDSSRFARPAFNGSSPSRSGGSGIIPIVSDSLR